MKNKNKNIVVFASGSGSNAVKIYEYFSGLNNVNIASLYCNNPNAKVLERFKSFNIDTVLFSKDDLKSNIILNSLKNVNPDLIVLAGFLLKIPKDITNFFKNKIINIHPALLPLYGGKGMYGENIHKAVIKNKDKMSGLTIHYVNDKYDDGTIIFQKTIRIEPGETPLSLSKKILTEEHINYPVEIGKLLANDQ
ncbi:phosphoribosylglycinamide formyltransferase [Flavobacteriaceae bacterium]|nr:phosphoribosylglycinamide formyltransferase [Flavobacteriaceae bacterium]MDB0022592.1 phosphoribosylglycinamide formyltransferase [Flavobacteriaceae bacterium]MDB2568076.1 phosphoribosylglycinamide formyltransferase [Flavobacteriaceae bacterium]MDB4601793.1 phosphoribosylglycinamide formyltransferase [Flavobacteriaceae bacterium]MDB4819929.1 phosphoribosylglycinamide formyltransferase [Flavobacteriaceae bacterium]